MNIWDVGGQSTIRSYWRNYFELTDGIVWVVDSGDRKRILDSFQELGVLLQQEVCVCRFVSALVLMTNQKLAGSSLLVFANKQDLVNALTPQEISEVRTIVL